MTENGAVDCAVDLVHYDQKSGEKGPRRPKIEKRKIQK
jgi:hypothetical protein